jgi:aminoglycoside phosphotransferase (APT) family kinase protein
MTADRRHPHTPFDRAIIEGFLDGRDILSAELLHHGKSNTNYKLILGDNQTCVLRMYSNKNPEREVRVMDMVRDLVPVPAEIARGESWSVFSFIEGNLLQDVPEHSSVAAEALARIHSMVFDSVGWIEADGSLSPFDFGEGKDFVVSMFEHPDVLAWLGAGKADVVRGIWEREAPRRASLGDQCCLVHGDFNPTNILVRDGKVSGILDWEFAHANTPYMDIGNLLRNTDSAYHGHVESGLRSGGMDLPKDWVERAELVDLGSHLEFLTTNRADTFKRQCVARVDGFIRRFSGGL